MSIDSLTIDDLDVLFVSELDDLTIEGGEAPDQDAVSSVMSSNQKLSLLEPMPWDMGAPAPDSSRPPDPSPFSTLDKIQLLWEYPLEPLDDEAVVEAERNRRRRRTDDFYIRRDKDSQSYIRRRQVESQSTRRRLTENNENN